MKSRTKPPQYKTCTHFCPGCKQICNLFDQHEGMHSCGLHQWVHGLRGTMTIMVYTGGYFGQGETVAERIAKTLHAAGLLSSNVADAAKVIEQEIGKIKA